MKQNDFFAPDVFRSIRINLLPLSSRTFRLDDDLYMADTLEEDGDLTEVIESQIPVKLEICAIIFCRKGEFSAGINRKDFVLGENEVLLVMPGSILESLSISSASEVVMIAFNRETLPRDIHAAGITDFLTQSHRMTEAQIRISPDMMDNFILFYQAMRNMLLAEADKRRQYNLIEGAAYIIMNVLEGWVRLSDRDVREQTKAQRIVSSFMADLHRYVLSERELSFYADRAAVTPKHFSRVVLRQTGKRPSDHIRDYLALEAKCMLSSKKYTIKQVAEMLNFSNTSAFTRFFRTATGATPAEYALNVR